MIFYKLSIVLFLLNGNIQKVEDKDFNSFQECKIFMHVVHEELVKNLKGKVYKIQLSCAETRLA